MVEVRAGQHHARLIPGEGRGQLSGSWQPPQRSASARPPDLMVLVPPPSIPEMIDQAAVGPPAALASPLRTAEADDGRELGPVDRVEPAMLAADRHLATPPSRLAEVNHLGVCSSRYAQTSCGLPDPYGLGHQRKAAISVQNRSRSDRHGRTTQVRSRVIRALSEASRWKSGLLYGGGFCGADFTSLGEAAVYLAQQELGVGPALQDLIAKVPKAVGT